MNNSPGRPRGGRSDARERILEHARALFIQRGYGVTSLRMIATAAQVDVALISYYFASKRGLFAEAVHWPLSPTDVLDTALLPDGGIDPGRLLVALLRVWENPQTGPPLQVIAVAALQPAGPRTALQGYLELELLPAIARRLSGPNAERRARAAIYLLLGALLGHYVLGLNQPGGVQALADDLIEPFTTALYPTRTTRIRQKRTSG
jgi:AcrR family transcriptional regulator